MKVRTTATHLAWLTDDPASLPFSCRARINGIEVSKFAEIS